MAVEERLLPEDHAGEHAAQTPHVQAVVVHLRATGDVRAGNRLFIGLFSVNQRRRRRRRAGPYLVVYQQLRSFKVPGRHSHVVLLVGVVELRQAPVDEPELPAEREGVERLVT